MWFTLLLWSLYFIALYFSIFMVFILVFEPKIKLKKLFSYPTVSIVIPAWNEESSIKETVESALRLDYPRNKLHIIAVDHGSSDRTGRILDSIKGIKILHIKRKDGDNKAVAFNNGLRHVNSEFVACLDADSLVAPGALKAMLPYFMESDRVAAVTPLMLVKEPKNLLQALQKYEYIVSLFIKRLASHINCIYVAPGPFSVYNASVLKKLGGFDEHTIAEDMEIVYRLQKRQYLVRQCFDGGYSYAAAPPTIRELYKQRERWYGGSLSNLYKYRDLALNRKYGDFAFFQMPRNLLGIITVFTTLGLFGYFAIKPVLEKLYQFFIVRFEIMPYISSYNIGISIFDLRSMHSLFIVGMLIFTGLFFFVYSCYMVKEKFNKKSLPSLIIFFTAYPLLLCCMYLMVILKKIARQKLVWNKMER